MKDEVAQLLAKADRLFDQAGKLNPDEFAEEVLHAAYYAMRHAALAALLQVHGTTPTKHGRVIDAFRQLLRTHAGDEGEAVADLFALAYTNRCAADYEAVPGDLAPAAHRVVGEAERVIAQARAIIGQLDRG